MLTFLVCLLFKSCKRASNRICNSFANNKCLLMLFYDEFMYNLDVPSCVPQTRRRCREIFVNSAFVLISYFKSKCMYIHDWKFEFRSLDQTWGIQSYVPNLVQVYIFQTNRWNIKQADRKNAFCRKNL